ncbi:MAG: hypothetical protein ACEY3L_09955 [Wolbachia sp.]|uniref:hypothetical protein n=1 Tax=Wolbachia endosymbiont (group B) of Episyrphus balteatus TaxID=2954009 RepID=UPI002225B92E|nr:hypothetical protein [Wolbachia endosymbiont (group B) of Episyrphus balteatus]
MPAPRHWHPVKFTSIKVMLKYNVSDDDGKMDPSVKHWDDTIYYANCHNFRTAVTGMTLLIV